MPNARGGIPSQLAEEEGWRPRGQGWERELWVQLRDKHQDETGRLRLWLVVDPPVGAAVLQVGQCPPSWSCQQNSTGHSSGGGGSDGGCG